MSRNHPQHFQTAPRSTSSDLKHKKETAQVIASLNSQLKGLSKRILNQQPYLLSVPTDVPYRHSSRVVNNWHQRIPFAQDEEHLQYMSFLPHQDDDEELLWVQGGWSDEKGSPLDPEESPQPPVSTGRNTPFDPQRKKISLKDYKKKDKSGIEIMSDTQQVCGAEMDTLKDEGNRDKSTIEQNLETKGNVSVPQGEGAKHSDIGAANLDGAHSPMPKRPESVEPDRPRKKQRTNSPQIDIKDEEMSWSIDAVSKANSNLPGLLSPTLPSPDKERSIPALVSPTLPASITEYLSTPSSHKLEAQTEHHRTDSVRSILVSAGITSGNRIRSDSQHSVRSTISVNSGLQRAPSPGIKNGVKTPVKPGTPLQNGVRASPGPRQRHIIALKYGKKNRKRIEGLLKFAPRSRKVDSHSRLATKSPESPEHAFNKADHEGDDKKPPLEQAPELVSKKNKALNAASSLDEKPNIPSAHASKPANNSTASAAAKSAFSTPKRDLKAAAMARVASNEGAEARTPTGDRNRLSTPSSVDRPAAVMKLSPQSTVAPMSKDQERAAWHTLSESYFTLGRTIKREATAIGQDNEPSRKESALSVILLIEGLLCFMINLCAETYSRSNQDPGWNSILLYHIFVFRAARRFPHLHGIVTQLGAVCRQYIHKFDLDKLAREPLPEEQIGSAPTPGSDGNTKTTEDAEKYRKKYIDFRDQLVLNSKELQTAWMDGSRELSLDVIEREYPKSWSRRARDSSTRGIGRPSPFKISEDYFLPLDANATAFEAARFTLAFLEEWAAKEGVDWKTRIDI